MVHGGHVIFTTFLHYPPLLWYILPLFENLSSVFFFFLCYNMAMKIKHIKSLILLFLGILLFSCGKPNSTLNSSPQELKKKSASNLRYPYKTITKNGKKININKDYGDGLKDIVIFSTNDGLSAFNDNLTISAIKYYYDNFDRKENFATLVDTGNFSVGSEEAATSLGRSSIDILNAVGYDIIVPGSFEFNYGIDKFKENMAALNAHVVCCNIYDTKNEELLFAPYVIYRYGDINIGFVGVTSPEAIFLKNNYDKFFDSDGKQLLYFFEDENGSALYWQVQKTVDDCKAAGADKIVLLAHLGIEGITEEFSSIKVIENTKNIDAVIDGHSMEVLDNGLMLNLAGSFIPLVQAGSNYRYLGAINISKEDYINQAVLKERSINKKDESFQAKVNEILNKYH